MKDHRYGAVVITVSDSSFRGEREDRSGPELAKALEGIGLQVLNYEVVSDDYGMIVGALRKYVSNDDVHLICTTGGTGLTARDVTPEATQEVIERNVPGIPELLRISGAEQTRMSWLSRGIAGVAGGKLIINLPGSPKAMPHSVLNLQSILIHALNLLNGKTSH